MRSVLVHLDQCTEPEVATQLDDAYSRGPEAVWVECVDGDACLYIEFYRDHAVESAPADLERLKQCFGGRMPLTVIANVSGRHEGDLQVRRFVEVLLTRWPGVAEDDFSEHFWQLAEIQADSRVGGLGFFDYKGFSRPMQSDGESRSD